MTFKLLKKDYVINMSEYGWTLSLHNHDVKDLYCCKCLNLVEAPFFICETEHKVYCEDCKHEKGFLCDCVDECHHFKIMSVIR